MNRKEMAEHAPDLVDEDRRERWLRHHPLYQDETGQWYRGNIPWNDEESIK